MRACSSVFAASPFLPAKEYRTATSAITRDRRPGSPMDWARERAWSPETCQSVFFRDTGKCPCLRGGILYGFRHEERLVQHRHGLFPLSGIQTFAGNTGKRVCLRSGLFDPSRYVKGTVVFAGPGIRHGHLGQRMGLEIADPVNQGKGPEKGLA